MSTLLHNTTVTYGKGSYSISQPTNGNFEVDIATEDLQIESHPSLTEAFYLNGVALDRTKITNIVSSSRANCIAQILDLRSSLPVVVSSVTNPITVSGTLSVAPQSLGTDGTFTDSLVSTSLGGTTEAVYRVQSGSPTAKVYLVAMSMSTNVSLLSGAGVFVRLNKNPVTTGGSFATVPTGSSSIVQLNTTFSSVTGGIPLVSFYFKQSAMINLQSLQLSLVPGDSFSLFVSQGASGSSGISLIWQEVH